MSITSPNAHDSPVLYAVPRKMYEAIHGVLHTCNASTKYDGHHLVLPRQVWSVTPEQYGKFLEALGDFRLRHAYDGDRLEMSPRKDHDYTSRFMTSLIWAAATELNIGIQSIGSTTLTGENLERGIEPDEAFYVANEPAVRGKMLYEPNVDPPPDLVIEVDVTSESLSRLSLFAKLGVPEIWRHVGDRILMYQLVDGQYEIIEHSISFPFFNGPTLMSYLEMRVDMNDTAVIKNLSQWLREQSNN